MQICKYTGGIKTIVSSLKNHIEVNDDVIDWLVQMPEDFVNPLGSLLASKIVSNDKKLKSYYVATFASSIDAVIMDYAELFKDMQVITGEEYINMQVEKSTPAKLKLLLNCIREAAK